MPLVAGTYPKPVVSAATLLWTQIPGVLSCLVETAVCGGNFYHQAALKNLAWPFLQLLDALVHTY